MKITDLLFDAELLIKDDGKYYKLKHDKCGDVVDAYGVPVKVILCKGERVYKKDLLEWYDMSESTAWKTQGSRVYCEGKGSFNCINIITAKELCNILNNYELNTVEYSEIYTKLTTIETLLQEVLNELKR